MANDLYSILELTPEATEKEIKAAYFKLVKKYPPDKNPEKFQEIRRAYETLRDPKARANYDAVEQYGEAIKHLTQKAQEHENNNNWEEAAKCYKMIIVLSPGLEEVWFRLGSC